MAAPDPDLEKRLDRFGRYLVVTFSVTMALVASLGAIGFGLSRADAVWAGVAAFWIFLIGLGTRLKL
jgi:hypothetical protein